MVHPAFEALPGSMVFQLFVAARGISVAFAARQGVGVVVPAVRVVRDDTRGVLQVANGFRKAVQDVLHHATANPGVRPWGPNGCSGRNG